MPVGDLIITITAIMLGSVGQLLIKMGLTVFCHKYGAINTLTIWAKLPQIVSTPQIIISIFCFIISASFWSVVLSRRDLSQVYPFIAMAHLFIALMAYFILKEQISMIRIVGIAIIVAGVVILAQDKVVSAV